MVTLNFKLCTLGSVQSNIITPTTFEIVLGQYALKNSSEVGSVIAVRNGKVLGLQDVVLDGDVIDVYPAISGG